MRKFIPFSRRFHGRLAGAVVLTLSVAFIHSASAQEAPPPVELTANGEVASSDSVPAEFVSIHVDGGAMRQVLNSFAMQANRNIVLGPDVTNDTVTIHLNNVQWDNALDVILKPYGYGYREIGNAIVIGELSRLKTLEAVEPLQSRVFKLHYLDANDVRDIIEAQLSSRGKMSIITARGQKGWSFGSTQRRSYSRSGSSLQKRVREEGEEKLAKSKTVVVSDVPSVLDSVAETLAKIDRMPQQVLIESKFMEVNEDLLRDIGVQMRGDFRIEGHAVDLAQGFFQTAPNAFGALSEDLQASAAKPKAFGTISAGGLGDSWALFISLIEEDEDTKTLSAPNVLTLNNQEATIIIGGKFPIIESDVSGDSGNVSVSLDYYESIGIQLNVVPQICDDGYINMIVHPSVSSIEGFVSAGVGSSRTIGTNTNANTPLAEYPVIKIREVETQILVADDETIVIGGLLDERVTEGVFKVPFLGDIPFLGHLFRRTTKDTEMIDLLIFLTATIVNEDNYDTILEENVRPPEEAEDVVEIAVEEEATTEAEDSSADLPSPAQEATEEALAEEDLSAIALAKAEALAEEEADSPDVPEDIATILSDLE